MCGFYGGGTLQDMIDSFESNQLDHMVVESFIENSYGEQFITLKVAVFNNPSRTNIAGKKPESFDFDDAMKVIK